MGRVHGPYHCVHSPLLHSRFSQQIDTTLHVRPYRFHNWLGLRHDGRHHIPMYSCTVFLESRDRRRPLYERQCLLLCHGCYQYGRFGSGTVSTCTHPLHVAGLLRQESGIGFRFHDWGLVCPSSDRFDSTLECRADFASPVSVSPASFVSSSF